MTEVINIVSGPGCGKSTLATHLFAIMKAKQYETEIVTEYAKELSTKSIDIGFLEQLGVFHQQLCREEVYIGNTDYLITDSPWILPAVYGKIYQPEHTNLWDEMLRSISAYRKKSDIIDRWFFLERQHPYNPNNRYEDKQKAEEIDNIIYYDYLDVYAPNFMVVRNPQDIIDVL